MKLCSRCNDKIRLRFLQHPCITPRYSSKVTVEGIKINIQYNI